MVSMTLPTLQKMCHDSIFSAIAGAPPMIQETIAGETRSRLKEQLRKEMREKLKEGMRECSGTVMTDIAQFIIESGGTYTYNDIKRRHPDALPLALECVVSAVEGVLEAVSYKQSQHEHEIYMYHQMLRDYEQYDEMDDIYCQFIEDEN